MKDATDADAFVINAPSVTSGSPRDVLKSDSPKEIKEDESVTVSVKVRHTLNNAA